MSATIARYQVLHGCTACMPNSNAAYSFTTRRELVAFIREQLDYYEMPQSCLRNETRGIREIWKFIVRHGSSTAHFSMHHKGMALEFIGLTEAEFDAFEAECDA